MLVIVAGKTRLGAQLHTKRVGYAHHDGTRAHVKFCHCVHEILNAVIKVYTYGTAEVKNVIEVTSTIRNLQLPVQVGKHICHTGKDGFIFAHSLIT